MSKDDLMARLNAALDDAINAAGDLAAERRAWETHSLAEIVAERDTLREQFSAARAAVVAMRKALLNRAIRRALDEEGRYYSYCTRCGERGGYVPREESYIEHTPSCCVGQALAAADAVLGEATP